MPAVQHARPVPAAMDEVPQRQSLAGAPAISRQPEPTAGVGEHLPDTLTDAEREERIRYCGEQLEVAMARWEAQGNFIDRADADTWRLRMEEAIRGRSTAQVARMEAERGLR